MAEQFEQATIFGASLSATFLGSDSINVKIVTSILIVLMSATTFTTQRQLMTKNMPASALDNPFAKQQKLLLYVLPLVFAVSGVNFPIGVLIYWFTTNVWSMCQQFYVIRRMPAPGSAAERAYHARLEKKGKPIPGAAAAAAKAAEAQAEAEEAARVSGQRQQPTSKKRKKAKGPAHQDDRREDERQPPSRAVPRRRTAPPPRPVRRTGRSLRRARRPRARRGASRPCPRRPDPPDPRRTPMSENLTQDPVAAPVGEPDEHDEPAQPVDVANDLVTDEPADPSAPHDDLEPASAGGRRRRRQRRRERSSRRSRGPASPAGA